jgi:SAM-dependent methyltransferase
MCLPEQRSGRVRRQTQEELREHFEIERDLAAKLRAAPSRESRRKLYAEVYRERSELIAHHPLVRQASDPAARAAAVEPQVALVKPFLTPASSFCELGAGDGAVAREVARIAKVAIALDVTDVLALEGDRELGFEFRVFDGFDLGLPDDWLDVAFSNDVVEHLHPDDMSEQAAAVWRALRHGGIYVCVTPNRLSGPHDVSRHFGDAAVGFHLHEYTTTELADTFRRAGFSKVKIVLTIGTRRLSPLVPAGLVRPLEAVLGLLPQQIRRALSRGLAAVKVVAVK